MSTTMEQMGFEGHPDENQLLLALERELSPEESATIDRHLGSCWECRARSHELQRGILAFVEYREKRYLPSLAPPPHDFHDFPRQLRVAAGEHQRDWAFRRILRRLLGLVIPPNQFRWAAAIASMTVLVVIWTQVLNPPALSATELLTRAAASQNPGAPQSEGRTARRVHQKVRVSDGRNRTVVREFEWTIGSKIESARWDPNADLTIWRAPLTAEGFASWRESGSTKKDKVSRSDEVWTLETTTSEGAIRKASLVVRAKDFHPVEQHILFGDNQQLDFEEVSFEIGPQVAARQPAEPPQIAQTAAPKAVAVSPEIPANPPVNLSEIELAVRYLMFSNKWDLDEDLQISRGSSEVVVAGTASSSDRSQSIQAALSKLSNVRAAVTAPVLTQRPTSVRPPARTASGVPVPLLRDVLDRSFSSNDDRRAFVDHSLNASDAALSHAWVLKKLADRYNEDEETLLSTESRTKLTEMLRVHLEQLQSINAQLDLLIDLLPKSSGSDPDAAGNWRAAIAMLFSDVQQQDSLVAALIVGAQADRQDAREASRNLRNVNHAIHILLERLSDGNALK